MKLCYRSFVYDCALLLNHEWIRCLLSNAKANSHDNRTYRIKQH